MIPSITPPTDNLYKFISLFGLAIFLFAVYNLGIVYDESAKDKMVIEDLKLDVQKAYYEEHNEVLHDLPISEKDFKRMKLNLLCEELRDVKTIIGKAHFSEIQTTILNSRVNKLNVSLDNLKSKRFFCFLCIALGFISMIVGFFLWKRKEQDIRDKILEIEHIIKQKERDKKPKSKKKKKQTEEEPVEVSVMMN